MKNGYKGGVWGYEAYEVKNKNLKQKKFASSFTAPEKENYFFIFML